MKTPDILIKKAQELEEKMQRIFPALAPLAKQCFLNTIETTTQQLDDGTYFVITGDIPAMWLRDSAAQLKPYIKYAAEDEELKAVLRGVIARHAFYVNLDSYSNAFNAAPCADKWKDASDFDHELIWERKYEVDSLCASVYLMYEYYKATGDSQVLTEQTEKMLETIADHFIKEQRHGENSTYFFDRKNCPVSDTLPFGGYGRPVNFTGMTWSGFRPSDDSCIFNYLVPSNMMAVVAMKYAAELARDGFGNVALAEKCLRLSAEIDDGIRNYAVVNHPEYGRIYAYETDGFGNHNLMDDANSPSLLAAPYLGYCEKDDELYVNTRRFILSKDNPYYFEGKAAKGVGSPHTPKNNIWHIALTMQILTSSDKDEIRQCLEMLSRTHAGTNFMHESFNVDNPEDYTREWFAWANTLFAQMLETLDG
ncbi:MAG: glycoside hydrolase family 125 protein [Clostridia bacterium]|nr:glycoside hydrolase family 125 protein [Clostridia bacterium]